MWFNLLLLILVLKNELENYQYRLTDYLLTPITYKHSLFVTKKLGKILRNDITLLVDTKSTSIFRHFVHNMGGLIKINVVDTKLEYEEIKSFYQLSKDKTLFFVDNESLIYYPKLKYEGYKVIHYTNQLVDDSFCDLLIDSYYKIKNYDLNLEYYEFSIQTCISRWYKEICIRHPSMGSIHNTLYTDDNFFNKLNEDFNLFLINTKLINKKMYEVSDEYIKKVVGYLYKIGIIRTDDSYIPGLVECIFPYVFTNNLSEKYDGDLIVTGGVCLDRIEEDFEYLFDMMKVDEYCKKGKRFLFSYYCNIIDNQITVTRIN